MNVWTDRQTDRETDRQTKFTDATYMWGLHRLAQLCYNFHWHVVITPENQYKQVALLRTLYIDKPNLLSIVGFSY